MDKTVIEDNTDSELFTIGTNELFYNDIAFGNCNFTVAGSQETLFCDTDKCKVRIQGVEFDEILTRLHRLEQKGFWAWIKRIWRG